MFHLFKKKSSELTRLKDIASVFSTIRTLIKKDLMYYDTRHRRLFIAQPLAEVQMSRGADAWSAFLNNVFLYVSYMEQQEQWNRLFQRKEARAIAKAKGVNPALTKMDIERIRRSVSANIQESDIALPSLDKIEFYIVADTADAKTQTTIVGTFNPDTQSFEMVAWDEIQSLLATQQLT